MEYQIVIRKGKDIELKESYPTRKEAETKITKSYSKFTTDIVAIPDICLGLNLYRHNEYYGTVFGESKHLWFIKNINTPDKIDTPVLKENIKKWFAIGYLDEGIEDYMKDYGDFNSIDDLEEENEDNTENN